MNTRATLAVVRKDAMEIVLNRSALVTVLSPIFLAFLFAALNALLGAKSSPVLIYNPDGSDVERIILDSPLPDIALIRAASAEQVAAAFSGSNSVYALGLAVPPGYEAARREGTGPALTLYLNGDDVDPATGRLISGALAGYGIPTAGTAPVVTLVTVNPQPPQPRLGLGAYLTMFGLVSSFIVGAAVVAGLLLEEKEKETWRLLLVPPATLADVVVGKLLVGLGYQLLVMLVVLAIQGGYVGAVGLVLVFGLLGSLLGLALGLLFGSLAKNTSAFGAFVALVSAAYTVPALFVGPLGQALRNSSLVQAMQWLPTYYLARGILDALESRITTGDTPLDLAVGAGCAALVFGAALWSLRRLAADMEAT
jgi:ABC-2 type transport system permease protein